MLSGKKARVDHMTLLGGSEMTAGVVVLGLAVLLTLFLRRRGRRVQEFSALFLALVPVSVLLMYVVGIMLILHGAGVV